MYATFTLSSLHLAKALSNKLMGLIGQLHHPAVRLSALFANPLPKSISDSCRNIASLSKWSLIKMFDIKGQILNLSLLLLCLFVCFFSGRYTQEYRYRTGWGRIYHYPNNRGSLALVEGCGQHIHCQDRKFPHEPL